MSFTVRTNNKDIRQHDEWEVYNGSPPLAKSERINVTINPRKRLMMNAKFYDRWGSPKAVLMMFNRRRTEFALAPCEPEIECAFPIRYSRKYYEIATGPFCLHFGIDIHATLRFNKPLIDTNNHLILNLRDTSIATRIFRNPKNRSSAV